jgi:hypothetical protein
MGTYFVGFVQWPLRLIGSPGKGSALLVPTQVERVGVRGLSEDIVGFESMRWVSI